MVSKTVIPRVAVIENYWFDNNPILTHFMSALSVLFPEGEKFFMQSLTAYMKDHPEFKPDLIQFCTEERNHTQVHLKLNSLLYNSLKLQELEGRTGEIIKRATRFLTKKQKLLVTLCLEHLTALLADGLLQRPDIIKMMRSDAKDVWIYHATEETSDSHRHLAERIYKATHGNKAYAKAIMIPVTIALAIVVAEFWIEICKDDRENFNVFCYVDAANTLFGVNGYITGIIPEYLKWFVLKN